MHAVGQVVQSQVGTPCPWCTVQVLMRHVAQAGHQRFDMEGKSKTDRNWNVNLYECPACGEVNIRVERVKNIRAPDGPATQEVAGGVVYPQYGTRPRPDPAVPPEFAGDYCEACAIVDLSPQASAALSRRLLQALLRGPGGVPRKHDLHDEIEEAIGRGMRSDLAEQLHLVRVVGNFAAHPMKHKGTGTLLPVEPHEAEHLLDVISLLFDHYFVGPARAGAVKAAMNAKLAAAGKPVLP